MSIDLTLPKVSKKLVGGFVPHQLYTHLVLRALIDNTSVTEIITKTLGDYLDDGPSINGMCMEVAQTAHKQWLDLTIIRPCNMKVKAGRKRWIDYKQKCVHQLKTKKIGVVDIAQILRFLEEFHVANNEGDVCDEVH